MKYTFRFKKINSGRIKIEAEHKPDDEEVIKNICKGMADYQNANFTNIRLIGAEVKTQKNSNKCFNSTKSYEVTITETLQKVITVDAASNDEAELITYNNWSAGDYILGAENFVDVDFNASLVV